MCGAYVKTNTQTGIATITVESGGISPVTITIEIKG